MEQVELAVFGHIINDPSHDVPVQSIIKRSANVPFII